jgi:chromosome segregation protein
MPFQAVLARQLAVLAEQLSAAANEDTEALGAQIAELTASRDLFRGRAEELTALNDALSIELDARAAERETAAQAVATLDAERQRASQLASRLEAAGEQLAALQQERARLSAARQTADDEMAALRARAATTRAEFDAEAARLRADFSTARTAAEGEAALLREELAIARAGHRERLVAHLSQAFEEIDREMSIDDVLSAAANGLAADFTRVAVFVAASGRLEARYHRGFEPASGIERAAPALDDGSLLARAAASPELGLHIVDPLTDVPFAGSPAAIVTAPIVVRGELLALIYADDDGRPAGPDDAGTGARVADLVRRHAALRLDRLTVELKASGELKAYAKMLLDEVEYVYRADVSAKKNDAERIERLTENLRCARQIYQQRAAAEGPAMSTLIEDVLAATVAAKSSTPFGRELATAATVAHPTVETA